MGCISSNILMVLLLFFLFVVKEEFKKYLSLDCIFIGIDQVNEIVSNNKNMMEKFLDNININLFFEKNYIEYKFVVCLLIYMIYLVLIYVLIKILGKN